jgi:endonuclease/exonuclease/phosphatase (EEP) superfamily protein YafD
MELPEETDKHPLLGNLNKDDLLYSSNFCVKLKHLTHYAVKTKRVILPKDIFEIAQSIGFNTSCIEVKRIRKPEAKYIRLSFKNTGEQVSTETERKRLSLALKTNLDVKLIRLNCRPRAIRTETSRESSEISIITLNTNNVHYKKEELTYKLNKLQPTLVFLQETRRKAGEKPLFIHGYKVTENHMDENGKSLGMAICIRAKANIIPKPLLIKSNIMAMEITGKDSSIVVANVYVHNQGEHRKETLEDIKNLLEENKHLNKKVILAGDWNTTPEKTLKIFERKGQTLFSPFRTSNGTRRLRTRRLSNRQIDFAVESQPGLITSQKAKRGWCVSDHIPVGITVDLRFDKSTLPERTIFDRSRLQEEKLVKTIINFDFTKPSEDKNVKENVSKFIYELENLLTDKKVIRLEKKPSGNFFLPNKVKRLISEKHTNSKLARKKIVDISVFEKSRETVKRAIIALRKKLYLNFVKRGILALREHTSRSAWRWIKMHCGNKRRANTGTQIYASSNKEPTKSLEEKKSVWRNHFEQLSKKCEHEVNYSHIGETDPAIANITDSRITWSEIVTELKSTRKLKASGDDMIPSELYKIVENETTPTSNLAKIIYWIVNSAYLSGEMPDEWKTSTIVPIFKKGDPMDTNNYRGIALINTMLKIICKVIAKRLQIIIENHSLIRREQVGFLREEECLGQATCLIEACQRRKNEGLDTVVLFLDLKKAYDMVPHTRLIQKLKASGIGNTMLRFINNMYEETHMKVRVDNETTSSFKYSRGVRQGCPTSPLIFILYVNDMLENINPIYVPGLKHGIRGLNFADDTVILAENHADLINKVEKIRVWMSENSMEVNPSKCGLMYINPMIGPANQNLPVHFEGEIIPEVEVYTYLGIEVNKWLDLVRIAKYRVAKGIGAAQLINGTLLNKRIPLTYKKMLIQNFLIPTLMYGSEIYGMNTRRTQSAKLVLDNSLKKIVLRHNFCRSRAYSEFGLLNLATLSAASRARGFHKWETSRGLISEIIRSRSLVKNRKRTWSQVTSSWLKTNKIDVNLPRKELIKKLISSKVKKANEKDRSLIGKLAKKCSLKNARKIRMAQTLHPVSSTGVNALTRIRVGTFDFSDVILRKWSLLVKTVIVDNLRGKCLCCQEDTRETAEHILLICNKFQGERSKWLSPIIGKTRPGLLDQENFNLLIMRTLLGGETPTSGRKNLEGVVATINYLTDIIPKRAAQLAALRELIH